MAMFGERRGLAIGRSWATRIFAIAFAFFSVIIMAACAHTVTCPNDIMLTCMSNQN